MSSAPTGSCDHFWVIEGLREETGRWCILYTFRVQSAARRIYNHFLELDEENTPPELLGYEDFKIRAPLSAAPPEKETKIGSYYTGGAARKKASGPSTSRKASSRPVPDTTRPRKGKPAATRTSVRSSSAAS